MRRKTIGTESMPDWLSSILLSVPGPLVAVLVAVCAQFWLMRRNEKRQSRRAFAEAMDRCCEELENAAILYWTDNTSNPEVLVGKMNMTLQKMIRIVITSPRIDRAEKQALQAHWKFIQRILRRNFEAEDRHIDADMFTRVVGAVIDIRCEVAQIRG